MPQLPLSGLNQAIATGGNLFSQMINPQIKREDMQRAWRQHLDNLELQKAAGGRAAQAASDAHKLALQKLDPNYKFNLFKNLIKNLHQFESEMQSPNQAQSYIPSIPKINEGTNRPIPSMDQFNHDSFINPVGVGLNNPEQGDLGAMIASNPELLAQLQKFFPNKGSYVPSVQGKFPMESQLPSVPEMKKHSYVPSIPRHEEEKTLIPNIPDYVPNKSSGLPGGINMDDIIRGLTYQALGLKQPANGVYKETPEIKTARELEAKKVLAKYNHELKLEEQKTQDENKAKHEQTSLDVKRKDALSQEIPEAEELIKKIKHAKETIKNNKHLFGPGVGGLNFLGGPEQRKRGLKTKKERKAWGEIEDLFGTLVGKKSTEYSHKGLKVAFDLAGVTKPKFEEYAETVDEKLDQMLKGLESGHARDLEWYKAHEGVVKKSGKRLKFNPVSGRLE